MYLYTNGTYNNAIKSDFFEDEITLFLYVYVKYIA